MSEKSAPAEGFDNALEIPDGTARDTLGSIGAASTDRASSVTAPTANETAVHEARTPLDDTAPEEIGDDRTVRRETSATRAEVWAVVADGWTYSQWVVGNSRMRAVDPAWPTVGASIHHTIGVWPLVLDDHTVVQACTPQTTLVLLAKGRPLGKARITLRLSDTATGGCLIEMAEVPVGAPMGWLPRRLALTAAIPRNRECTGRLAAIAERRRPD